MSAPAIIQGLSEIAQGYDALLCDVWGVIHNGQESFPEALDALSRFKRERGPVILISNAPRPNTDVRPQLDALTVPLDAWSGFVTSGDATRALLAERTPGPAWAIGPDRDAPLYDGLGLEFAEPEAAAFIACTGPVDDTTETPEDYRARFEIGVRRDLLMICANPDRVVQRGDQLVYCGGALADLYETLGGQVLMAGKPHAPIYDLAIAEAAAFHGGQLNRHRLLCIGDGIETDLKGAADQDLDALFIAHGIHGAEAADAAGRFDPAAAQALLARHGAVARFAADRLAW